MIAPNAPTRCPSLLQRLTRSLAVAALLFGGSAWAGIAVSWNIGFSPASIGPGSTTTLTYTLNNESSTGVRGVSFTNVLPRGVTLAKPSNATSTCNGSLSAPQGGNTISLTDGEIPGEGSCVITVAVTSEVIGVHNNITGNLTSNSGNSGSTSANLTVMEEIPGFKKSFSPATVGLGARSTLTFTIDNSANEGGRSQLTFTDRLPAGLVVAEPPNVSTTCTAATITAVPGSNTISLAPDFTAGFGDMVDAFQSCTVSVDVVAQTVGQIINVSGELTSSAGPGGTPDSSGYAIAPLDVVVTPILFSKRFINDPVTPGATIILEYTIVNRSREFPLTEISFDDNLGAAIRDLVVRESPSTPCGPVSRLSGTSRLSLRNGQLPPQGSCTFRVLLQVPANTQPGAYPSTTSELAAKLDGRPVTSPPAGDSLFVDVAPSLSKTFVPGLATPGDTVTMRFSITNNSSNQDVFDLAFEDELPGELSTGVVVPDAGFCGDGSSIQFFPGTQFDAARLIISGASLKAGDRCTFDVRVDVALGASTGTITNTTGPLTGTINERPVTGNSASADLQIVSGPRLIKTFLDNPVVPGGLTRLRYTLSHAPEAPQSATDISFTDDLGSVLDGLVATNLPLSRVCGPNSLVRGTSVVDFRGGDLRPGESCSFVVELLVPRSVDVGPLSSTSSPVTSQIGGASVQSGPATANVLISGLSLRKSFTAPAIPGGTTTLEFTITNAGNIAATEVTFFDNLDDAIPGMKGVRLPITNLCGDGSSLVGSGDPADSVLTFEGGTVPAQSSCTFSVLVEIPADTPEGFYLNATSELFARIGQQSASLPGASGVLEVTNSYLELTNSFADNSVVAGGQTNLEFTLTNIHPARIVRNISFTDTLPAGLVSTAGTVRNFCGPQSELSGTSTINVTLPVLNPGQSCTFTVPIAVAPGIPTGAITNRTSEVVGDISGLAVRGDPASASLEISVPFALRNVRLLPNGNSAVVWSGTPGRRYCIQWSNDLVRWNEISPPIPAASEVNQFIDSGPPFTPSRPGTVPHRYYRVVEKGIGVEN